MRPYLLLVAVLSCEPSRPSDSVRARISLEAPEATLQRPFSRVSGIRELGDGRVIVSDDKDIEVVLADFNAQTATTIGGRGQGPLEYAVPMDLVPMPNGHTLIQDPGNARFLELGPNGEVLGAFAIASKLPNDAPDVVIPIMLRDVRGSDSVGRLYFEVLRAQTKPGERMTVPIVRWDSQRRSLDTVADYDLAEQSLAQDVKLGGPREVIVRPRAWTPRPQWAVAVNGAIAVVEPNPYHVVWLGDGQRRVGTAVPYTPVAVTEEDREAFRVALGAAPRGGSGRAEARPAGAPPPTFKRAGEPIFPDVLPPFIGRQGVDIAPDGTLWVARAQSSAPTTTRYDIFDASGELRQQAHLRPSSRIVGFGAHAIYVARRDADDLEYLERYRR